METIFWKLFNTDSEQEVTKIISENSIFLDSKNWKPYGGNEGNFGTFEGQQNHPIPALVEKIINSIDAILIKQCKLQRINPESNVAPKTMFNAVEQFYNVKDGEIGELTEKQRRELAENIQIIAVGDKTIPSIIIYDDGEGQYPEDFEDTFLSLQKNNKTKIPFVQGVYNMGSTGAVLFCGDKKYQLIGSKKFLGSNEKESKFGFTLVRKHPLTRDEEFNYVKATWYEYFSPNNQIPSFPIDELDLGLYNRKFKTGTIVKLYSYQLPSGSRSDITLDLWRDLNQYMYHLPLPISVYEKRGYGGKSPNKLVLGNRTRILIDSRENVLKTIPFNITDEDGIGYIPIEVVIFNNNVKHEEFIKNKSIIYTQNGQVHAYEGQSFISQELGFSLLKRYILIHVDCTNIPTSIRQELFMSNRTQLREGKNIERLRKIIINLLSKNPELKKINEEMRNSLILNSENDENLIKNLLSKLPIDKDIIDILIRDGSLNFLRKEGVKKRNENEKRNEQKKLKRFPSIFKIKLDEINGDYYKTIPLNKHGRIEFETDVENAYLFRPYEKGKFEIQILQKRHKTDKPIEPSQNDYKNEVTDIITINREGPIDGTIRLIITPNHSAEVGDEIKIKAILSSPGNDLECIFYVKIDEKIIEPEKKEAKRNETFPNMPIPRKAYEKPDDNESLAWNDSNLNWTGQDIVKVSTNREHGELIVDFIIVNMDSNIFKNFLRKNKIYSEKDIKYYKNSYFISIYLHSLFLFSIIKKMHDDDENLSNIEVEDFISNLMKPYASFLLYQNFHLTSMAFDE